MPYIVGLTGGIGSGKAPLVVYFQHLEYLWLMPILLPVKSLKKTRHY